MASYWLDSKSGDDVTGDGSELNPWKTLRKAVAAVTAPLTEDTYVYLKNPGDGTLYTGDFDSAQR